MVIFVLLIGWYRRDQNSRSEFSGVSQKYKGTAVALGLVGANRR